MINIWVKHQLVLGKGNVTINFVSHLLGLLILDIYGMKAVFRIQLILLTCVIL